MKRKGVDFFESFLEVSGVAVICMVQGRVDRRRSEIVETKHNFIFYRSYHGTQKNQKKENKNERIPENFGVVVDDKSLSLVRHMKANGTRGRIGRLRGSSKSATLSEDSNKVVHLWSHRVRVLLTPLAIAM